MTKIIAFTGKMGSGKTTLAGLIRNQLACTGIPIIPILKFADPLYDMQDYAYTRLGLKTPAIKDRKFLQFLGTEWARAMDQDIFLKVYAEEIKSTAKNVPFVLTDDARYDNEGQLIKDLGGTLIRVNASVDTRGNRIGISNPEHASEKGIADHLIDKTVVNEGSLEDLDRMANRIVRELLEASI